MMYMMSNKLTLTLVICLSALLSSAAFASGDGETLRMNHIINSAILLVLLFVAARKPIMNGLSSRADAITKEIDDARQALDAAQELHDQYEGMIAALESEREELLAQYRSQGEAERQALIDEGKREAERLAAEAERAAKNELIALQRKIESELIDLALEKAEGLLKSEVKTQDQSRLVQDYMKQLEELGA
jgi:F-type H+-transporting ATPase subunit b